MTPVASASTALRVQRDLVRLFENQTAEMAARVHQFETYDREWILDWTRIVGSHIRRADLVLWRPETAELARNGHDAFLGTKVSPSVPQQWDQLWFDYAPTAVEYRSLLVDQAVIHTPIALVSSIGVEPSQGFLLVPFYFKSDTDHLPHWRMVILKAGTEITQVQEARQIAQIEFLKLPFVRCDAEVLPRAERRRLKRDNADASKVKLVYLRRIVDGDHSKAKPDGVEGADGDREWSCQWVVRGHWRKQWYASVGEHRPVWIDSHLKGPEHLPVKVSDHTVMKVVR